MWPEPGPQCQVQGQRGPLVPTLWPPLHGRWERPGSRRSLKVTQPARACLWPDTVEGWRRPTRGGGGAPSGPVNFRCVSGSWAPGRTETAAGVFFGFRGRASGADKKQKTGSHFDVCRAEGTLGKDVLLKPLREGGIKGRKPADSGERCNNVKICLFF